MAPKRRPKKRGARQKVSAPALVPVQKVALSDCTRKWIAIAQHPFGTNPGNVCLPDSPAHLSRKVMVFAKGTGTTSSANNYGYVIQNVLGAACNDSTNASSAYWYTSADTYTGTTMAVASATGLLSGFSNADYTTAQVVATNPGVRVRPVACALRVRYIGTQLNAGGRVVGLSHPTHGQANENITKVGQMPGAKVGDFGNEWFTLSWVNIDEGNYKVASDMGPDHYHLSIQIESAAASQPFEYEMRWWYEYIGTPRGVTVSESDPVGFAAVQNAWLKDYMSSDIPTQRGLLAQAKAAAASQTWSFSDFAPSAQTIGGAVRTARDVMAIRNSLRHAVSAARSRPPTIGWYN